VLATTVSLLVYALPPDETQKSKKASGKKKAISLADLKLLRTVDRPTLPGKYSSSTFRAVRYHPNDDKVLYTVVNTTPPRTRTKASPRCAFVCKWNTETWQVTRLRKVSDKGVTCFDMSKNGKLSAFGSSDYTIGILDAYTLAPLLTILKAHDFPPTTLRFNSVSSLLVSGSADNTVRIVTIPESLGVASWSSWIIVFITLIIMLLAFMLQQM